MPEPRKPLQALTLRHPWPYAITDLGKRVEDRHWRPFVDQLAEGDWFAIHGGVAPKGQALREALADLGEIRMARLAPPDLALSVATRPGIVAVCRFGGVVTASDDPWFHGPFGWLLGEVVRLPRPVECRGAQGLWIVPEAVAVLVREQFRIAKGALPAHSGSVR